MEELPIQSFSLSQRDYIPNYKLAPLGPWLERRVIKTGGNSPSLPKSPHGISRNSFLVFNNILTTGYIVHGESRFAGYENYGIIALAFSTVLVPRSWKWGTRRVGVPGVDWSGLVSLAW